VGGSVFRAPHPGLRNGSPCASSDLTAGFEQTSQAISNLFDDLLRRAEQGLAFLDDLSIPFTNHQAERDLRRVKVQQKSAGTFRAEGGATAFCHMRSYLSTLRKQGHAMLNARSAVFAGRPLPVAWPTGRLAYRVSTANS